MKNEDKIGTSQKACSYEIHGISLTASVSEKVSNIEEMSYTGGQRRLNN